MIDKVKDYLDVKVRIKDPLDEGNAHLVPSSGLVTGRTFRGVTHGNAIGGNLMNSMIRC